MLLAVNGTLMQGLELNENLIRVGAAFLRETKTASCYRVWSIQDRYPGMLRVTSGGAPVSCEVWEISPDGLADILNREPAGLTIGKVKLDDDTEVLRGSGRTVGCGGNARDYRFRRLARIYCLLGQKGLVYH